MIETNHLAVEMATGFKDLDTEKKAVNLQLINKQVTELHNSPDMYVGWSMDPAISVELFRDEEKGENEGRFLLSSEEELNLFTRTLIQHPILLPASYAQNLSMKDGIYCLQLVSRESLMDFTERLFGTLKVLNQKE